MLTKNVSRLGRGGGRAHCAGTPSDSRQDVRGRAIVSDHRRHDADDAQYAGRNGGDRTQGDPDADADPGGRLCQRPHPGGQCRTKASAYSKASPGRRRRCRCPCFYAAPCSRCRQAGGATTERPCSRGRSAVRIAKKRRKECDIHATLFRRRPEKPQSIGSRPAARPVPNPALTLLFSSKYASIGHDPRV